MPQLYFMPDDRQVETNPATSILEASLGAGLPHTNVCGGNARCSTCRVVILEGLKFCGARNAKEQALAAQLGFNSTIRLACQTSITGDVKVRRLVLDDDDVELTNQIEAGAAFGSVGQEMRVALLFADIRGFTSLAETLLPYDVIHVLNRYFHHMDLVITRHGGYIDNYMGDGLLAVFGVEHRRKATLHAVKAGIEMLEAVEKLNPYIEALHGVGLQMGIGIHYGDVVAGSFGPSDRKRDTVIGDAVNLASRIEAANKQVGTRLLISESAYEQVKTRVRLRQQVRLGLRGKSGEYALYEVNALDPPIKASSRRRDRAPG